LLGIKRVVGRDDGVTIVAGGNDALDAVGLFHKGEIRTVGRRYALEKGQQRIRHGAEPLGVRPGFGYLAQLPLHAPPDHALSVYPAPSGAGSDAQRHAHRRYAKTTRPTA
jgi:hypothetical protein